jgi:hypothetical protein
VISTPWICAPAGVPGPGALAVRAPQAGALGGVTPSARPRYAVVRTMTPFGLTGTGVFGSGVVGTDQLGTGVVGTAPIASTPIHERTTLGIHPPRRPQS